MRDSACQQAEAFEFLGMAHLFLECACFVFSFVAGSGVSYNGREVSTAFDVEAANAEISRESFVVSVASGFFDEKRRKVGKFPDGGFK